MGNTISKKLHFTYHIIASAMRGNPYTADDGTKAIARAIKEYLLEVLNSQNKGGKIYDPVIACQAFHFYGHQLAWNKNQWENSAGIVYRYFKAKVIIDTIKKYEAMMNEEIVSNYLALLTYIYECLTGDTSINFDAAPGLTPNFVYVPIETLEEKLEKFKELYE